MRPCGVDTKATLYGTLVTLVLSCTMVVAGLKAGITPGVSPLVVLCGWGAFKHASVGAEGSRFLNLAQVAGSSGMAVVSGAIFSEPLLQVLHLNRAQAALQERGETADLKAMPWRDAQDLMSANGLSVPPVSIPITTLACLVGSLIGFGFVGLATRRFLSDPSLPAPEAHACESMIKAAVSEAGQRPKLKVSLVASLVASLTLRVMTLLGVAAKKIVLASVATGHYSFVLDIPVDNGPLYLGIGGLLTLPTALLTFAGALLRLIGDYMLAQVGPNDALSGHFPANSMRWVGGGAMTVAVVFSLLKFLGLRRPHAKGAQAVEDAELLDVGLRTRRALMWTVGIGLAVLAVWLFASAGFSAFSVLMLVSLLVMAAIMVPLGAILSLQIGSSSSPVSGTVFVTTLVLCAVALATGRDSVEHVPTITALLVAACVAVCAANDASQDYKTLQLCGLAPREGFLAEILGLVVGSIAVPCALYVSSNAFGLGTESLPAPQGQMFATLVDGLLLQEQLPWYPIAVGSGIGLLAVAMDAAGARASLQLPSMAVAVGIYLHPDTGVGILIGSLFRCAGERLRAARQKRPPQQTHECVLAAAGMITGSAFLDLALGVAILFSLDPSSLAVFSDDGVAGKVYLSRGVCTSASTLSLMVLGYLLFSNSLHGALECSDEAPQPQPAGKAGLDDAGSECVAPCPVGVGTPQGRTAQEFV